jgi:hypothetical protein
MSSALYTRLNATVIRMLKSYGQEVTLRRYSQGAGDYNPATGSASGGVSYTDTTRNALTADQPGSQIARHFGQTLQKGSQIANKEKWLYLDASGAAPTLMDHVLLDGVNYSIVNVQVTAPGGVALFYMLVLQA